MGYRIIFHEFAKTLIGSEICCLVVLVLLQPVAFSDDWPRCNFHCQADDVIISRLWLGGDTGKELSACTPGERQEADLWAEFRNNAKSPRYAIILLADLYINGILNQSTYDDGLCITDSIPPKSNQSFPVYRLVWNCGDEMKLSRLILSWETTKGTGCGDGNRKCANRNSQCYSDYGTGYLVETPLAPSFLFDSPACSAGLINFSDRTRGGLKPYLHYWDFGDGIYSDEQNPSHRYAKPGNYTVTLFVTDQSQKKASTNNSLVIRPCGCDINGLSTTCSTKNETYSAKIGDPSTHAYSWKLDGQEMEGASQDDGKSIDINWRYYASGLHDLQLIVATTDNLPREICRCSMTVTVLPIPDVTVTRPSD